MTISSQTYMYQHFKKILRTVFSIIIQFQCSNLTLKSDLSNESPGHSETTQGDPFPEQLSVFREELQTVQLIPDF